MTSDCDRAVRLTSKELEMAYVPGARNSSPQLSPQGNHHLSLSRIVLAWQVLHSKKLLGPRQMGDICSHDYLYGHNNNNNKLTTVVTLVEIETTKSMPLLVSRVFLLQGRAGT